MAVWRSKPPDAPETKCQTQSAAGYSLPILLGPGAAHLLVTSLPGIPESKHQTLTGKVLGDGGEGVFDPMAQEPSSTKQPRHRTEDSLRILTRILPQLIRFMSF